jgi:hypothetical protein
MASLNRALALAEVNTLAVLVGQYLDLDVPWLLDVSFDVNAAVVKGRGGFR